MRKLTVEFEPNYFFKKMTGKYLPFDKVESIELLELLRWDAKKGIKLVIAEIKMHEGYKIDDFNLPTGTEIISILNKNNNKYTCLVRGRLSQGLIDVVKQMIDKSDINLILDTPNRSTKQNFVMSVIGDQQSLQFFIDGIKKIGIIKKTSFIKPIYQGNNILTCLTEKQRKVISLGKNLGYYEYPRKINSEELSKKIGLSRTTTIEHLRKAENRIMAHVLTGY